jgi:hypothetical protein
MSRLDSHIRQKLAQRDSLNLAAAALAGVPGVVVEFGLGAGRSYSHLRERFPGMEVVGFDRHPPVNGRGAGSEGSFYRGEFAETLADPVVQARFEGRVILAHIDIGAGGPEDETVPELVMSRIHRWLRPGAFVLSDQELTLDPAWGIERVDTRGPVEHPERYHVYRRG